MSLFRLNAGSDHEGRDRQVPRSDLSIMPRRLCAGMQEVGSDDRVSCVFSRTVAGMPATVRARE